MESGRRGRKYNRRNRHQAICASFSNVPPRQSKPWSFLSGIFSFLLMSSLMCLIYLMLEYHCMTCNGNCNMDHITKNIDVIANNLSLLKDGYHDLEQQISKLSQELPRLEGQIDILEALANTLEKSDLTGWNPKDQLALPYVDVYLSKTGCNGKNVSRQMNPVQNFESCTNATCPKRIFLENQTVNKNHK